MVIDDRPAETAQHRHAERKTRASPRQAGQAATAEGFSSSCKFVRAVRPPGLARVPVAHRGRVQGGRQSAQRLRAIRRMRRSTESQPTSTNRMLPAAHGLPSSSNISTPSSPPSRSASKQACGVASPLSKVAIRRISSGPSDCFSGCFTIPFSSSTTTTFVPSCTNRDSRAAAAALPGPAAHGAPHACDGRPRDLHQRLLPANRHRARSGKSTPATSRWSAPAPTLQDAVRTTADPSLRRAALIWPRTSA